MDRSLHGRDLGPLIWMTESIVSDHPSMSEDVHFPSHSTMLFICPSMRFFIAKQYHSSVGAGTFITVKEDQVLIDLGEG